MNVRRFLQSGAVWGWPILDDPLTDARSRYDVTGNPGIVDSPWGRAMSFDGTNDYLEAVDNTTDYHNRADINNAYIDCLIAVSENEKALSTLEEFISIGRSDSAMKENV